jgi:hypothetical protein
MHRASEGRLHRVMAEEDSTALKYPAWVLPGTQGAARTTLTPCLITHQPVHTTMVRHDRHAPAPIAARAQAPHRAALTSVATSIRALMSDGRFQARGSVAEAWLGRKGARLRFKHGYATSSTRRTERALTSTRRRVVHPRSADSGVDGPGALARYEAKQGKTARFSQHWYTRRPSKSPRKG